MAEVLNSPIGRLVQGNLWEPDTKDNEGNPLTNKAGEPRVKYWVRLAIPKNSPEWAAFYAVLVDAAKGGHAKHFDAQGNCTRPDFSWKITDGDSVAVTQKSNVRTCDQKGFAGCWVVNFSSGFAPKCFKWVEVEGAKNPDGTQAYALQEINEPNDLKIGYHVQINYQSKGNNSSQSPGIYINMHNVLLTKIDEEIVSAGGNPANIFKTPMPVMQSAAAVATPAPGTPPPPAAPVVAAPPAAATAGTITPAPEFLDGPAPPPPAAAVAAPPAPAPVEKKYLHAGKEYTEAQLVAGKWTAAQIAQLPLV
jgi:hypothetical protein